MNASLPRQRGWHRLELLLFLIALAVGGTAFVLTSAGGEWLGGVVRGWIYLGAQFRVVNTSTPWLTLLLPTVVSGGLVYLLMVLCPHPGRPVRAVVILLLTALYTLYMAFRLFATWNFSTWTSIVFSALFFLAELLIYLKSLSANLQMFWPQNRSPEADRSSELVTTGRYLPDVDIFIPTYSEPVDTLLALPMTLTVFSTFWKPFGKPFKVSAKGETKTGLTFNPVVGVPLLVLLALYVPAVIYAVLNARWAPDPGVLALAVGWSLYSLVLLWLAFLASLDVPQPSSVLRFKHLLPATVRRRGVPVPVTVEEISDGDVIVTCDPALLANVPPRGLTLSVPACGLREVPVSSLADDAGEGRFLLKLDRLPVDQHRALITFLYCRPNQWDERGVPEPVTFWHFLQAPFRMYPLAETR